MFKSSVCSYPVRGSFGDNKYRGNCTGHIIRDFVESYLRKGGLFADPSIGGGTSMDVAKAMGLDFFGTDLHSGFNLLTDDMKTVMQREANLIWWHPPYWSMIQYSGNQWGKEKNPWDLSTMPLNDFCEAMMIALMNIHDATENNGHYGILMGNLRKNGLYYNLSSMVERMAPGRLIDEIIKIQHNCWSDSKAYPNENRLVRISHEKLLVFRKETKMAIYLLNTILQRAHSSLAMTWRAAVRRILQQTGTKMALAEIYEAIKPHAENTENQHWKAKVRQILQDARFFKRVETGVYELVTSNQ